MTQEQAINQLRFWYGWHGYSEAEREAGKFLKRLNAPALLRECLAICPKMPPRRRKD